MASRKFTAELRESVPGYATVNSTILPHVGERIGNISMKDRGRLLYFYASRMEHLLQMVKSANDRGKDFETEWKELSGEMTHKDILKRIRSLAIPPPEQDD